MITIKNQISSTELSHIKLFEMHMDILKNINPILCDIYKLIISDLSTYSWLSDKAYEGEIDEKDINFLNIYRSLLDIAMEYIPYHIHQFVFNSADDNEFSPDFCEGLFLELMEIGELDDTCSNLIQTLSECREHNVGLIIHNDGDF